MLKWFRRRARRASGAKPDDGAHIEQLAKKAAALHEGGDLAGALWRYEEVLEARPDDLLTVCRIATIFQQQGALDEALWVVERGLAKSPDQPDLLARRAHILKDLAREGVDDTSLPG